MTEGRGDGGDGNGGDWDGGGGPYSYLDEGRSLPGIKGCLIFFSIVSVVLVLLFITASKGA